MEITALKIERDGCGGIIWIEDQDGKEVVVAHNDGCVWMEDDTARLLTSSPAMLAALEAAPIIRLGESLEMFRGRYGIWWREVRGPAIAGATGEASDEVAAGETDNLDI
jgi:hypothetical protein